MLTKGAYLISYKGDDDNWVLHFPQRYEIAANQPKNSRWDQAYMTDYAEVTQYIRENKLFNTRELIISKVQDVLCMKIESRLAESNKCA